MNHMIRSLAIGTVMAFCINVVILDASFFGALFSSMIVFSFMCLLWMGLSRL